MTKSIEPEFGLYVHIPFCEKKCIYCDFYSIERMDHKEVFVSMLKKEIYHRKQEAIGKTATSVFFGGGTPSLMSVEQMNTIIQALKESYEIHPNAEWTMECNPGTISEESLKGYRELGINRLSFGIQSFHKHELDFLHRIHTPEEAEEAIHIARNVGFDNINIDIIFALPNQTMESWKETVRRAIALNTEHISAYSLIFEEKTPLFTMLQKGEVHQSDEHNDADMYEYVIATLQKAGYHQYEVSNFAKPGKSCSHNRTYWLAKEYLAFGPSAHGYVNNERYWNYRNLMRYLESVQKTGSGKANSEILTLENRLFEAAFLSFRAQGISISRFLQEFSVDLLAALGGKLELWLQEKLVQIVEIEGDRMIALTPLGYSVCDELSLQLIEKLEFATGNSWEQSGYEESEEQESTVDFPLDIL